MLKKSDFSKWIAFAFPYIAQLLYTFIEKLFFDFFHYPLEPETLSSLFLLINSLSILFGFKILHQYTQKDNCKNYSPKNYNH